jgi:hypothetical protein
LDHPHATFIAFSTVGHWSPKQLPTHHSKALSRAEPRLAGEGRHQNLKRSAHVLRNVILGKNSTMFSSRCMAAVVLAFSLPAIVSALTSSSSDMTSYSFGGGCTDDCDVSVSSAFGSQDDFCALASTDKGAGLSCLDDCGVTALVAAHCACNTGTLFANGGLGSSNPVDVFFWLTNVLLRKHRMPFRDNRSLRGSIGW